MTMDTTPPSANSNVIAASQVVANRDVTEEENEEGRSEQQHAAIEYGHRNLIHFWRATGA
jgi:hypothetical protein